MAVRRVGTLLTLMGLAVIAALMGPGTSGRAQDLPATVQIYEGSTHVGYLGPTLPVEDALANAAPYISAIWYFDRFDANSPWKLWSAGLPGPLQGFSELTFGEAYFTVSNLSFEWVYADGAIPAVPAGVDLVSGGNSVVYLGPTQPVEDALGLNVAGLRVAQGGLIVDGIWRNDPGINPNQPWALWSQELPPPLRGFDMLESGAAYFFTVTAPGTLSFAPPLPPCTLCQDPPTAGGEDYGDAPASYDAGGAGAAFHTPEDGFFLGDRVDVESGPQSSADASGDDLGDGNGYRATTAVQAAADDDDGVEFLTPLIPGGRASVRVLANASEFQFTAVARYLNAWIDVNQNGVFDHPTEHVIDDVPIPAGATVLSFDVPAGDVDAREFFVRFRLSHTIDIGPVGGGGNGEVEDYFTGFGELGTYDFGDAPASYGTLEKDDGARHLVDRAIFMGLNGQVDTEPDGKPSLLATGDDLANDDEDGILLHGPVSSAGTGASVTPSVDGFVDAWVDFDNDGVFHPTEERVLDSEPVFVGLNNVVTLMPNNPLLVVDGERYARFRFSTAGGLGPTGEAPDGEVEDYLLIVSNADPLEDWGDAPLSYGTVWPFGAGHTPDPLLRLGSAFDLEGDGQPSDAADGDDLAGGIDDEDGVTFGPFIPGQPLTVTVTSSGAGGWVQGWFDENDNGMFEELAELFMFGTPQLQNGVFVVQSVVDIPPDLFEAYFRFRISEGGWLGPTGYGGHGEVEDYFLFALPFDHTVSGSAIFSGGRSEGPCTAPPLSGFSDTLFVSTQDSSMTIRQPSTGDVNTGHFDPSTMTFEASSSNGESYAGDYLDDWSFTGVNRYPVGSSGCIFIWDVSFHPR